MDLIPFASFLAGSIISLVMPTALLVVVIIWYHLAVRRFPASRQTPKGAKPERPPAGNPGQPDPPASSG